MRMQIAIAATLSLALSIGIEAAPGEPAPVGVFTEYIAVAHAEVPELLRQYAEEDDGALLRERLGVLIENGHARIVESSYLVTTSGQRAKLESIREWIYPTEFDPPELPQDLTGPIAPGTDIITETNPTAYEMRPVGHSVEVDPVIQEEKGLIALNFAPEIVSFLGNNEEFGEDESQTVQPVFYSMKAQAAFVVAGGVPELFGVYAPANSFDHGGVGERVLGFVTATILLPKSVAEEDEEKQSLARILGVPEGQPEPKPADEDEEESDESGGQVTLLTEYIEVDASTAHSLVSKLEHLIDATALRRGLDEPIKAGSARLLESSVLLTRLGQRAKTESILEYIYPTEFDPAEMPQAMKGPIDGKVRFMTSCGATAFEMRPTGITVEADPSRAKGQRSVTLNIASETVRMADMLTHGKDAAEAKQPLFETLKFHSAVSVPANATVLLAMHGLESARAGKAAREPEQAAVKDKRVLVFVTNRVREPGAGPGKK